jgi:hypothetical protein
VVVFQFNPVQLSRSRKQQFSLTASAEGEAEGTGLTLRDFHQGFTDLRKLRDAQSVFYKRAAQDFWLVTKAAWHGVLLTHFPGL